MKKVGAHHVDGDDGGDVSDGGGVEDSYNLPCKLSIHWNVTDASKTSQELRMLSRSLSVY